MGNPGGITTSRSLDGTGMQKGNFSRRNMGRPNNTACKVLEGRGLKESEQLRSLRVLSPTVPMSPNV